MHDNRPAGLQARINHYRQMLRSVDDPALCEALEILIRRTQEKLANSATARAVRLSAIAKEETEEAPTTALGEFLYAKPQSLAPEREWMTLVRSIAAGDQLALHALWERVGYLVYTFGFRLTARRRAAEELTINVFHDLWKTANGYDPADTTVLGWVMSKARAAGMDHRRFETIDRFVTRPLGLFRPSPSLHGLISRRIAEEHGSKPVEAMTQRWYEPEWQEVARGIECKVLAADAEQHRISMLVRLAPDASYPAHVHAGTEELYLLDGELWIDLRKLLPGEYNCGAPGTQDERIWSETGCTCVLVTSMNDRLLRACG